MHLRVGRQEAFRLSEAYKTTYTHNLEIHFHAPFVKLKPAGLLGGLQRLEGQHGSVVASRDPFAIDMSDDLLMFVLR